MVIYTHNINIKNMTNKNLIKNYNLHTEHVLVDNIIINTI